MQAITYDTFGPARAVLSLKDIEQPALRAGEVRVRLVYSGVNPSDVKARSGSRPGITTPPFPIIVPHSDGAGEIEAVGAGVDPSRVGQRVWVWNGQWQRAFGTAATHITLPAYQAVPMPASVGFDTGACLGIPGLTACHAVFGGGGVAGETVFVQGGAGTVGLLAVQLAKWGGAKVISTCSTRDRERVSDAGADTVLAYDAPDLAAQVLDANGGKPVETVVEVEFGCNIAVDSAVIAPNGRIAAYGSAKKMSTEFEFGPLLFKAATIDIILIYLLQSGARDNAIHRLHDALADGALTCPIEHTFALAETAAAHEAVEAGGRLGAVLVSCAG